MTKLGYQIPNFTYPDVAGVVAALQRAAAETPAGEWIFAFGLDPMKKKGMEGVVESTIERWFTPAYRDAGNADFVGYTAMLERTTVDGYAGTCAALRDADLTESTRALKVPVLCIVGDQDRSTPPDLVRSTADLIQGARFEIVNDAGHLPCIEQPAVTAALIRNFLQH